MPASKNSQEKGAEITEGDHKHPPLLQPQVPPIQQLCPNKRFDALVEDGLSVPRGPSAPTPIFANHLFHLQSAWTRITSDQWVLRTVDLGYTLLFVSVPPLYPTSLTLFSDYSHKTVPQQEVQLLLQSGAIDIVPVSQGEGVLSLLFAYSESKRRSQIYPRFKSIKQIPKENKILQGSPSFHYSFPGARGLLCCPKVEKMLTSPWRATRPTGSFSYL